MGKKSPTRIQTHACRAQWMSSPSPWPLGHLVWQLEWYWSINLGWNAKCKWFGASGLLWDRMFYFSQRSGGRTQKVFHSVEMTPRLKYKLYVQNLVPVCSHSWSVITLKDSNLDRGKQNCFLLTFSSKGDYLERPRIRTKGSVCVSTDCGPGFTADLIRHLWMRCSCVCL